MHYWYKIHRWTSLICTIFFLLLCITGLPLIFKNEIHDWNLVEKRTQPAVQTYESLWAAAEQGKAKIEAAYPEKSIQNISAQPQNGRLLFRVQDKNNHAMVAARMSMGGEQIAYEVESGNLYEVSTEQVKYSSIKTFMHWMHVLHMRMGMGNGGMLFLGFMCFLSLLSIFSGVWLYAPFMRNTTFGTLRQQNPRMLWMDWHKFTGIVTTVWASILCLSGIMIVVFSFSYNAYIAEVKSEAAKRLPDMETMGTPLSLPQAMDVMQEKFPCDYILSIDLPSKHSKTPNYIFYVTPQRENPTEHLGQLVFVPSSITNHVGYYTKALPGYFSVISFFLDLHMHNHETMALKIVWVIFTLITVIMLISGVYAWVFRSSASTSEPPTTKMIHISEGSIWRKPTLIGGLSLFGLVAPLYSEFWQNVGCVALLIPLIILVLYGCRGTMKSNKNIK